MNEGVYFTDTNIVWNCDRLVNGNRTNWTITIRWSINSPYHHQYWGLFFFFFFFTVNGQVKSLGTKWADAALEAADELKDVQIYKSVVQSMEEWKQQRRSSSKRWEPRWLIAAVAVAYLLIFFSLFFLRGAKSSWTFRSPKLGPNDDDT